MDDSELESMTEDRIEWRRWTQDLNRGRTPREEEEEEEEEEDGSRHAVTCGFKYIDLNGLQCTGEDGSRHAVTGGFKYIDLNGLQCTCVSFCPAARLQDK